MSNIKIFCIAFVIFFTTKSNAEITLEQKARCSDNAAQLIRVCENAGGTASDCGIRGLKQRSTCEENRKKHNEKFNKQKTLKVRPPEVNLSKENSQNVGSKNTAVR